MKKPREQAGSYIFLPLFPGVSRFQLLPGCRCSRSTNGSTTTDPWDPDQPCIGGGLGIWPTYGLISGEVWGVISGPGTFQNGVFSTEIPLGMALETSKKATFPLCQSLERGMVCFLFRAVNLPAAVVPKKCNSLKQQKPCHHGTNQSHEIGSNDQFFQLFLQ